MVYPISGQSQAHSYATKRLAMSTEPNGEDSLVNVYSLRTGKKRMMKTFAIEDHPFLTSKSTLLRTGKWPFSSLIYLLLKKDDV